MTKLIFDKSKKNTRGCLLPEPGVPITNIESCISKSIIREDLVDLPEVTELTVMRHYISLSHKNHFIEKGFYPLGSCTMKYNPKINDQIASLPRFKNIHPYMPSELTQGTLQIMYELQSFLADITGMDKVTLQPSAGSQGELTGLLIVQAYFKSKGQKRTKVIIPDSAHGTNPATSKMCGFDVVEIKSNEYGQVDIDELKTIANEDVAAIMLTNPNTLGLFEDNILEISKIMHDAGSLLYYDGANLNAIMGIAKPGDMGFDIVHINTHKTFSTPHGGGGPGSGPVAVKHELASFLPVPIVEIKGD